MQVGKQSLGRNMSAGACCGNRAETACHPACLAKDHYNSGTFGDFGFVQILNLLWSRATCRRAHTGLRKSRLTGIGSACRIPAALWPCCARRSPRLPAVWTAECAWWGLGPRPAPDRPQSGRGCRPLRGRCGLGGGRGCQGTGKAAASGMGRCLAGAQPFSDRNMAS